MKPIIFSDIDGTFLNYDDYNFNSLNNYISDIKTKCHIIFTSSKTFNEIKDLNKKLNIDYPFIVENGACIFFPKSYFKFIHLNSNFFSYKGYKGHLIKDVNLVDIKKLINPLKTFFKFNYLSKINTIELSKITGLKVSETKNAKKRMFTDPIYWMDSEKKKKKFENEINLMGLKIEFGGRFMHVSQNFNKGMAVKQFLKIINIKNNFITISLGDSQNDLSMLNLTDYSCVIKSKKKLDLKKSKNKYYSKIIAPEGWKESLDYIFKKEKIYF